MEYAALFIALACVFGFFMAWGVGANDVANAMGTSVGSRALTIKQAVFVAAIFEFAGAWLAGGEVTQTIRSGMLETGLLEGSPEVLVYGMLASLLAAGTWLLVASFFGWPVSTTHSIVGAIVGFAIVALGMEAVQWDRVGTIAMSWVVSPALAGVISFALFRSVQLLILDTQDPLVNARRFVPFYMFLAAFFTALITLLKGLKHMGLEFSMLESYVLAAAIGLLVTALGVVAIRRLHFEKVSDREFHFTNVEKVFGVLMVVTACAMAFAHGSNDVANAVGPLAAVVSVSQSGEVNAHTPMPMWILLLGGAGIVLGLVTYGHKVIATVGRNITQLTPSRGFAATLAAAMTVVLASGTGLPISTTHTLVGAILGVGLARGIAAINLDVVRTVFMSWIITLPAGALLSIIFFLIIRASFS
ncbi:MULTISPECIES: inorganic phosphate transporter [unclassified Ectothiorhodospira]|uniref:inorganic phosphate transporter n=1 Tax=unclassified Ectothiorhodospira TaxID=2684909 RepID=UPI001EE85B62|nr:MULTISPECIES: inorganic phosphate transporter [unclassified Ectothiorhodospira]MCG5514622.1 inorganic phosphate transporter [Ectothiorhodospira sp. 9100]MCG5518004.1 inorganic phosphate transporter [Ectothiorhodospira sp. 9905]